jgi:hypothetical protein
MRRKILLLGAGSSTQKRIFCHGLEDWCGELTTMDMNADHNPDILANLDQLPYDWSQAGEYDEIHAYEILEHTGMQGDWKFFFDQFSEFHRMLKKGGYFCATVPNYRSKWARGDPGHTRELNDGSLTFLSQAEYEEQVGKTSMTDYRFCYKADFKILLANYKDDAFRFVLEAQ